MISSALDARSLGASLALLALVALSAPRPAIAIPGLDTARPTAGPKGKIKDPPQITAGPETGEATAGVATTPAPSTATPTAAPRAASSTAGSATPPATAITSTPVSSRPATAALEILTGVANAEIGWSWLWWLLGGLVLVFAAGRTALAPVDRWPRGVAIAVGLVIGLAAGVAVPLFGPASAIVILVAGAATALRVALSGRPSASVTARPPPAAQANAAPVAQASLPSEPL